MDLRFPAWFAAAAAIAVGGYVHYEIWLHEYRHAPVREMFVANWVLSAVVVLALVVTLFAGAGRSVALLAGLILSAGSLAAFALSRGPGLPTLHGTFSESGLETTASHFFRLGSAKTILVTETIGALLCAGLLVRKRARA